MNFVPLTQAVTSGDAGVVKALLANGADVNERTAGGQTPLILAAIFGHTQLIVLLLDAGADPQLRDNLGLNAIDWAQRRGATEAIDVLTNNSRQTSDNRIKITPQTPRSSTPVEPRVEKQAPVSEEERSRRWIAGLKQRIAEASQREASDGPNIFSPQTARAPESQPQPEEPQPHFAPERDSQLASAEPDLQSQFRSAVRNWQQQRAFTEREPQPEIPAESSKPQPEIPATPEPQPEIPAPAPDPKPDLPAQPEPELPAPPASPTEARAPETRLATTGSNVATTAPKTTSSAASTTTAASDAPRRSGRKRCPKCNAIYNSDLVAYCAHHIVPLVDYDEQPPIISQPQTTTTSPVLFWMIIIVTLTGSIVVGSIITAFFYSSKQVQPAVTASQAAPNAVQRGTPVVGEELEGKVVSLPIAECPLNGQEAIPGTVVVHVAVDKTGQVREARASGGDWLLRGAATEAAMKSTFAPEKLRGRETEGDITYTFEP